MSDEQRNDGLHPRHPGRGCATTLIEAESVAGNFEDGGFVIFFGTGETKFVHWHSSAVLTPTLDIAKKYTSQLADALIKQKGIGCDEIQKTNWTSVCAAVQRILIDFNHKLQGGITAKILRDTLGKKVVH